MLPTVPYQMGHHVAELHRREAHARDVQAAKRARRTRTVAGKQIAAPTNDSRATHARRREADRDDPTRTVGR